jgi:hypothetical protein
MIETLRIRYLLVKSKVAKKKEMTLQAAVCTRTLMVAAAATAAADGQGDAGSDDVELAGLLPRRALHLVQRLLPPLHGGDV